MTKTSHKPARKETWMEKKWRPAIAIMYLIVCVMDFIIFPIAYSWVMVNYGIDSDIRLIWKPLTLEGGGLFHIAMGAVLGVSAWSRGQEKITRYRNGYRETEEYGLPEESIITVENESLEVKPYRYRG